VPRPRQARGLPFHLAVGHGGSRLLRGVPRFPGRAGDVRVRPPARRAGRGAHAEPGRVPRRAVPPAGPARGARCCGLPPHACGSRGGGRRAGRRAPGRAHGVLPRGRADPRDPPLPRGLGGEAVPARDDRGRPVGAQHHRARHRGDLRRAVRQHRGARAERAHPAVPRRQRDPADGGSGPRPRRGRGGAHPERPGPRVRRAPAHPPRVPAGGGLGAPGPHVRRARHRPQRAGAARAGGPPGVPDGGGPAHRARHRAGWPPHAVRSRRRGDARGPAVGRAAGARGRRDHALRGRDGEHRFAAPDDARGARPARARWCTAATT
jgi:hypothetical protein